MNNLITYKGSQYTMRELAELTGIKVYTLHRRICILGWDVERAVDTPVRTKHHKCFIEYQGKQWTVTQLAEYSGVGRRTLYARIYNYGWTVEEAVNIEVRARRSKPEQRKSFWQWLRSLIGR